ncbi:hypothetical protein BDF21DRAFT_262850 [Thamnidium elegans]|nr:hypothetical protein BDF21DRAFT_262850 [Thamnidium elegans]
MDSRGLTLGQAAFLVLSVSSNRVNEPENSMDTTHEDVRLSFSYPETPQLEEREIHDKQTLSHTKVSSDEGILFNDDVLFDGSLSDEEEIVLDNNDNHAESTASINYEDINDKPIVSKKQMLSFAKTIFSLLKPQHYRHDYMFVTPNMQYHIITSHLNIGSISVSKLSSIITKDDFISFMSVYKGAKGRWLYVLREPYRDELASEINQR